MKSLNLLQLHHQLQVVCHFRKPPFTYCISFPLGTVQTVDGALSRPCKEHGEQHYPIVSLFPDRRLHRPRECTEILLPRIARARPKEILDHCSIQTGAPKDARIAIHPSHCIVLQWTVGLQPIAKTIDPALVDRERDRGEHMIGGSDVAHRRLPLRHRHRRRPSVVHAARRQLMR